MIGFISRMYQHFGCQIQHSWATVFAPEFARKQKNIEKFIRAHSRFLDTIDTIVLFHRDHAMMAAFEAVNDSILDFCECFANTELFPTLDRLLCVDSSDADNKNLKIKKMLKVKTEFSIQHNQYEDNDEIDFEELQLMADQLFRHQFKVSIAISKYRCCMNNFISLAQNSHQSFEFKYDILNYQPCLDQLFSCHNIKTKQSHAK